MGGLHSHPRFSRAGRAGPPPRASRPPRRHHGSHRRRSGGQGACDALLFGGGGARCAPRHAGAGSDRDVRQAVLLSADPEWYQKVHDAFLDALEQEAPAVEDADLGLAYVDLTGMERLYPQVDQLHTVVEAARERGLKAFAAGPEPEKAFDVRAAAGPNKFVACIAALAAPKEKPWIVLPYEARRFLRPTLRRICLSATKAERRLALFGLERLGQIAELDPSSMQAQFGAEGRLIWELSGGSTLRRWCPGALFAPSRKAFLFRPRSTTGLLFGWGSGN